ncbi:AMP-activated protein kinase, glycogen-binding domain containing protein, partial [Parasponia andersonii]
AWFSNALSIKEEYSWRWVQQGRTFGGENFHRLPNSMASWNLKMGQQRLTHCQSSIWKRPVNPVYWRLCCMAVNVDESSSLESELNPGDEESASKDSPEELLAQPLSSDELKALLADSERANLLRKLSESNQQNRFLKRQLHIKEEALVDFKSELAVIEREIQVSTLGKPNNLCLPEAISASYVSRNALVKLAEEIANSAIPEGSRKINGKYIQSHLLSRLDALLEKLKEQIKDVDAAQSKEVPLFWYGVAESVQVMGTFDGWSQGEFLSPEYTGSYTKFSTTLLLRPGRYEIKFLVDGEWQLSPEFPTVGEGLTENNLLVVE